MLTGDWRTVVRSGAYLTNDDGLYLRTSPLTRPGAAPDGFRAAIHVWAQVCSRPEPALALLTMGRRDVSFDQDMPVPQRLRRGGGWSPDGLAGCEGGQAQRSACVPGVGAGRRGRGSGGRLDRVRGVTPVHGIRQVAADPGARRQAAGVVDLVRHLLLTASRHKCVRISAISANMRLLAGRTRGRVSSGPAGFPGCARRPFAGRRG